MRDRAVIKRNKKEENPGEIDLTPMLDVVFIMLIFFIVTASFIKEAGIDVRRPEAATSERVKNQNILVAINAQDQIWIDKAPVDPRVVQSVIERMHAENPKGAMVIEADGKSTAEMFGVVYDAAKKAGVANVSLATVNK